jgi:hypothetical protein
MVKPHLPGQPQEYVFNFSLARFTYCFHFLALEQNGLAYSCKMGPDGGPLVQLNPINLLKSLKFLL